MSLTLSMTPTSHVFNDYPYERSNTLSSSNTSTGTVRYYGCRQVSGGSLPSDIECYRKLARCQHDNVFSPRTSRSSMQLSEAMPRPQLCKAFAPVPSKFASHTRKPQDCVSPASLSTESFHSISLDDEPKAKNPFNGFSAVVNQNELSVAETDEQEDCLLFDPGTDILTAEPPVPTAPLPFRRWLSTLRRRKLPGNTRQSPYQRLQSESDENGERKFTSGQSAIKAARHRNSTSHTSSSGVVSAVRSATMTIADTSIAPRSWIGGHLSNLRQNGSLRSIRASQDSHRSNIEPIPDERAWARAVQRRKILEELIESEESYIADLKVLVNVYFTLLTSVCALSTNTRASVRENVTEILQMHEALLGELHEIIPNSELNQNHAKVSPVSHPRGHVRWRSADSSLPTPKTLGIAHKLRRSLELARPVRPAPVGIIAAPKIAAEVARIFERFAIQLFAYEEYGAKYEMMVRDLGSTYKTLGSGQAFEKGIEILSKTLESINARDEHTRKGMTFGDLVIKPIQRVCKYPLLFADLCKHTPVVDDPEAHAELEKVLFRLKEATNEINKATDDPKKRDLIGKTWLLQDRLRFPGQTSPSLVSRVLGRVQLCGALHVTYQTKTIIQGQYMLCSLFKSCLVLAVGEKGLNSFSVVASIPLLSVSIEDSDNGKGLQCHTAPFSWKLMFELDHRLFEIILSACNPLEEGQWKKHLSDRACNETLNLATSQSATQELCSSLALDLKPLGTLYGQPHTVARQISIHRAATIGPKSQMSQVIVRNTHSVDQIGRNPSETSLALYRSQSVLSSSHVQVLAPRRSERINLELAMSEVWTRDILPFPGMKQSENPFKASANHVMRKLSMASITSTLSKRTSSFVNFNKPDRRVPTPLDLDHSFSRSRTPSDIPYEPPQRSMQSRNKTSPPLTTVDFHRTPEMFLPPDFELKDPRLSKPTKERMTVRAVTAERPNSTRPISTRPAARVSTSKLRRSVTTQIPPVASVEIPKSPANLSNRKNNGVSKVAFAVHDAKENVQIASKPVKPFAKQFRRFFN